ncbi:DUF2514 domain-containing protein, partial [Brenneria nigrifluens DSM 30175 = ATCC 13028]
MPISIAAEFMKKYGKPLALITLVAFL